MGCLGQFLLYAVRRPILLSYQAPRNIIYQCRADTIPLVEYTVNCITTMAAVPVMENRMSTAISSTLSTNPGMFCNTLLPLEVTRLSRTASTPLAPDTWMSNTASHRLVKGREGKGEGGGGWWGGGEGDFQRLTVFSVSCPNLPSPVRTVSSEH